MPLWFRRCFIATRVGFPKLWEALGRFPKAQLALGRLAAQSHHPDLQTKSSRSGRRACSADPLHAVHAELVRAKRRARQARACAEPQSSTAHTFAEKVRRCASSRVWASCPVPAVGRQCRVSKAPVCAPLVALRARQKQVRLLRLLLNFVERSVCSTAARKLCELPASLARCSRRLEAARNTLLLTLACICCFELELGARSLLGAVGSVANGRPELAASEDYVLTS